MAAVMLMLGLALVAVQPTAVMGNIGLDGVPRNPMSPFWPSMAGPGVPGTEP